MPADKMAALGSQEEGSSQQQRDTRFAHLLQPIRDLAENWSIDVASELEEYLHEVKGNEEERLFLPPYYYYWVGGELFFPLAALLLLTDSLLMLSSPLPTLPLILRLPLIPPFHTFHIL